MASAHTVSCWDLKHAAIFNRIYNGIWYLRDGPEDSVATLDPDMCWRLSCSWGAAISWCNSDKKNRKAVRFHDIARDAQTITDGCFLGIRGEGWRMLDHRPEINWQVVAHQDDC
ncbi:hypothetical protein BDW69DRAFT_175261 [Aspergillus filifer]